MLLRKLMATLCPLILCAVVCTLFKWLDSWLGSSHFWAFALKGALLGAALALTLPVAGIRARTNGLAGWLLAGAALLLLAIVYQHLETTGAVHWPVLASVMAFNGQVVLVESAVMGYLTVTGLWYRKR